MSALGPEPKCLPSCEETHDEDCPVPAWEAEYWANYFGLRKGNTPEVRNHNRAQLRAFAPPGRENAIAEDD